MLNCRMLGWLLGSFAIFSTSLAENWPQFRGVGTDGVAGSSCPLNWTATHDESVNVQWKVPIAGEGWSCPIVWGDNVFLTAAVPISDNADGAKPVDYQGGGGDRRDDLAKTLYRYEVLCLDAKSGEIKWRRTAYERQPPMPRHSSNTYATETPLTDGKFVYAYFGMTGVVCLTIEGELQWKRELGAFEMRAGWGTSSSPVLFDGKLFLQVDNEEQSFLVALDTTTGNQVWRVDRDEKSQYSTPLVWKNSLRDELIVGGMVYRSYDPRTGELLWQLDMEKGRSSATPIAWGDRLFVGTELRNRGGDDDGGGFLFAITPGGWGDITPSEGTSSNSFVAWKIEKSDIQMASPAICDGRLYFLERQSGNVHCLDAETGESLYRERIRGARAFWASPITTDDRIYCVDSSGTTFVLAGGPNYELLATNEIDEITWSSPAVADGRIYFRTVETLYCLAESE